MFQDEQAIGLQRAMGEGGRNQKGVTEGRQSMQVTGPGASNGARCTSPFRATSLDPPTAGLSLLFLSCALGLGCREQGSQGLVAFEQERHEIGRASVGERVVG